jgi:putative transposase
LQYKVNAFGCETETIDISLSQILKMITMKYAIFFNKKYHFVGQLMQGRFKSELIENDQYFLTINRYLHLNPVKAKMVEHPLEYRWSSCREYFEKSTNPLIKKEKTLGYFPEPKLERYKEYLEKGISGHIKISEAMWESLLKKDEEANQVDEKEEIL